MYILICTHYYVKVGYIVDVHIVIAFFQIFCRTNVKRTGLKYQNLKKGGHID